MHNGVTSVAFYDTLGPDAARYICNQTELTTIACSSDLIDKLVKLKKDDPEGRMKKVVNLLSFESNITEATLVNAKSQGVTVITFDQIIKKGKEMLSEWVPYEATPDDVCMFSYTSGTTGDPKGVKLTHKMALQCAASLDARLARGNA